MHSKESLANQEAWERGVEEAIQKQKELDLQDEKVSLSYDVFGNKRLKYRHKPTNITPKKKKRK